MVFSLLILETVEVRKVRREEQANARVWLSVDED